MYHGKCGEEERTLDNENSYVSESWHCLFLNSYFQLLWFSLVFLRIKILSTMWLLRTTRSYLWLQNWIVHDKIPYCFPAAHRLPWDPLTFQGFKNYCQYAIINWRKRNTNNVCSLRMSQYKTDNFCLIL